MRALAALSLVTACGRSGFVPVEDGALPDGSADATPCVLGSFGPPAPLVGPVNSATDDWTPSITRDDLSLVFYSQRPSVPGAPDIWLSLRPDPLSGFSAATVISESSSPARDVGPHLVADGLDLFLLSDRPGSTQMDVYLATRTSTTSPFGAPVLVTELSSPFDEDSLWVSYDGLRVMFSSNRGTSSDLYAASRPDRLSPFSPPMVISELSTPYVEGSPAMSADELEILFVSNRPGGVGAYDVWRATRASTTTPFATPTNVAVLNSPDDEWGLAMSSDGYRVYYAYNATLAGGNADIWIATRACQ